MTVNQSDVQASIRSVTGTAYDYNGDWMALFDQQGIALGPFDGRMLAWINAQLGTPYTSLPAAQQAYAVSRGFPNWSSMTSMGFSLNNFSPNNPLIVPHRGGSLIWPEHSKRGNAFAYAAGFRVMDGDVEVLSDNGLGNMHDTTVDRTTTSTGNVSSFSTPGFQALAIDANTWHGSNFGNALQPSLFTEQLALYKADCIFTPEAKVAGAGAKIATALQASGIPTDRAVVSSFLMAELAAPLAAGYPVMANPGTGSGAELSAALAAGCTWAALDASSMADAVFLTWIAAGLKVVAYAVTRRWQKDKYIALGCYGVYSDDPAYTSTNAPLFTVDAFADALGTDGTWMNGMISGTSDPSVSETGRGRFQSSDYWGWPTSTSRNFVMMGWACPIKGSDAANNFTIDWKAKYVAGGAGDWAGLFIADAAMRDKAYVGAGTTVTGENGYQIRRLLSSTALQIHRCDDGVTTKIAEVFPGAVTAGNETQLRVKVTPTQVIAYQLDGSGNVTATATATDSTYRGGYFHLGHNSATVLFRGISVT